MKYGELIRCEYRRCYKYTPFVGYDYDSVDFVRRELRHPYKYRLDPVPYTAKYRNGVYRKRSKFMQERRVYLSFEEYGIPVRAQRNPKSLEYFVEARGKLTCCLRSWKRQKKRKQWM